MKVRIFVLFALMVCVGNLRAQLNTWISQNPPNLSGVYHAIDAVSATTAYIVGDKGTVTKTVDGGLTLNSTAVGTQNLYGVSFLDTLTGMIVGSNGVAYKTVDGGITWKPMNTGATEQLFGVLMVDQNLALICGGTATSGSVRITRDGGKSWSKYAAELPLGYVRSVRMLRPDFIVFVGDGGAYYVSRDSAVTFNSFNIPYGNTINDICFVSDLRAVAVGGPSRYILGTDDGGKSWKQQDSDNFSLGGQPLNHIDSRGGSDVVAVGDNGEILYSFDGGVTWNRSYFGAITSIKGVSMFSSMIGMVVGQDGVIMKTTDGGADWYFIPRKPQTSTLRTVRMMPDGKSGFAAGAYGSILATADSGHIWLAAASGTVNNLYGSVLDESSGKGVVVGEFGTILATTDAGQTWSAVASGTTKHLRDVTLANHNVLYAAGDSATILRSTDAGSTWTKLAKPVPDSVGISSIAFFDSSRGFITTANGAFRTLDGGVNWKLLNIPDTFLFTTIGMGASPTHLYLGGLGGLGPPPQIWHGTVAYTRDAGDTWTYTDIGAYTTLPPRAIYTADGYHATLVGRGGLILHTPDPDSVWVQQYAPTSADLFGVTFGTTHAGWSCGFRGTILRIDTDEEADVRNPLAVSLPHLSIDRIYPNPAADRLHVAFTLDRLAPTFIEIVDLLGKPVASFDLGIEGEGSHTHDLTLPEISSGTYLLVLNSGNSSATARISIIH